MKKQTGPSTGQQEKKRTVENQNERIGNQKQGLNQEEDKIPYAETEGDFEEFDEYADDKTVDEGNDQEYNSRYNDDREEPNEKEELHTDTGLSKMLSKEVSPRKGKRKRIPSTKITRKYGPIDQSEDESHNNDIPAGRTKTNKAGSGHSDKAGPKNAAKGKNKTR